MLKSHKEEEREKPQLQLRFAIVGVLVSANSTQSDSNRMHIAYTLVVVRIVQHILQKCINDHGMVFLITSVCECVSGCLRRVNCSLPLCINRVYILVSKRACYSK